MVNERKELFNYIIAYKGFTTSHELQLSAENHGRGDERKIDEASLWQTTWRCFEERLETRLKTS